MNSCKFLIASILAIFLGAAHAQNRAFSPEPARLAEIHDAMESQVAANHTAGAVTLVLHGGKVIHHDAAGLADRENQVPMTEDRVFWIASMTKSVTATTLMTLVDEGRLNLDEPASKWLPALAKAHLADGTPPKRPITLRDLMSHTSGLAFPPRKPTDGAQSLKGYVAQLVAAPLAFEPGTDYEYGFGLTVSGHIAEIAAGKPFDALMRERVLDPLGMKDTAFNPGAALRARFAKTYKTAEDGEGLARAHNPFVMPDDETPRMVEPSGGLFSTAADMARFYQMILDGGEFEGKRIVSREAIAEMTTPHHAGGKVLNYGLGWQCNNPEKANVPGFSANAFGHGGAFATHGWIDPERRLVTVLMVQNVLVQGTGDVRKAFHDKVLGVAPTEKN
ncbi:MAG: beta-lactamase family protein [Akkermansiaceae bacterium]|nr:beta-lactamase family protein [Akkermansiaceae bacterium]MCP5551782.1 beta-lactamase family protein [Akkermansiaceae bacterium]